MVPDVSFYQEAFAVADAGFALLDPTGEWRTVNPALCALLGRDAQQLTGTRAHEALFTDDTVRRIDDALRHGQQKQRAVALARDGRSWRISLAPLPSRHPAALLLQLEPDEAGQASAAATRMQEQLSHGISHDLRAPLRGIAGFAARLAESGAVAESGRTDLARIRAATRRAEQLVNALLELLRVSRQPMRRDEVDLSLLGDWVAGELQDADPARPASIQIAPGLTACGDEHWLKIMLGHVLGNAWKFSATRARVEIRVEGECVDGRVQLAVHDRGCGFDMRYADKLFLPFQRLHGSDQGGGSGLGLAIAHQVVERHGGRMWATSRLGEGSTFFIELPAAAGRGPDGVP
jgi:signal transduction histidine kinase